MTHPVLVADLDDTLVDTSQLKGYRDRREWSTAKANLGRTEIFPGVLPLISELRNLGVRLAILTTSVSNYAAAVCKFHGIEFDKLVAYHDCRGKIKPHPHGVNLCINVLSGNIERSLGLGDRLIDASAYRAASIPAWGAGWSPWLESGSEWHYVAPEPEEILEYFSDRLRT